MVDLSVIQWLDLAGVFVFASSGALVAARKRLDIFGFVVVGFITAVGGGTLRDMLVSVPVFWIQSSIYVWITLAASVMTFGFSGFIDRRKQWIVWFDAIGLSVFCVLGASKGLEINQNPRDQLRPRAHLLRRGYQRGQRHPYPRAYNCQYRCHRALFLRHLRSLNRDN